MNTDDAVFKSECSKLSVKNTSIKRVKRTIAIKIYVITSIPNGNVMLKHSGRTA